jgi:prepilin-type processing-associated H-X9-DG protein
MYIDENNRRFPFAIRKCANANQGTDRVSVVAKLYTYVNKAETFDCPSRQIAIWCGGGVAHSNVPDARTAGLLPVGLMNGYGWASNLIAVCVCNGPGYSPKLETVTKPSDTMYMADSTGLLDSKKRAMSAEACNLDSCGNASIPAYAELVKPQHTRHGNGSVVGFVDGHVKWHSVKEIANPRLILP